MNRRSEELPALLQKLGSMLPGLRREFPLKSMALFGSVTRGDADPESDLDILVDVDPSIGLAFVTLAERLEKDLGRKVDLVSRRSLRPSLWKRIEPELVHVEA